MARHKHSIRKVLFTTIISVDIGGKNKSMISNARNNTVWQYNIDDRAGRLFTLEIVQSYMNALFNFHAKVHILSNRKGESLQFHK